jgi:hypothetical protein
MGIHDPLLCTRRVILLEQCNDIKEMGADVIVEKLGGYEWHIGS